MYNIVSLGVYGLVVYLLCYALPRHINERFGQTHGYKKLWEWWPSFLLALGIAAYFLLTFSSTWTEWAGTYTFGLLCCCGLALWGCITTAKEAGANRGEIALAIVAQLLSTVIALLGFALIFLAFKGNTNTKKQR